MDKFEYIKNLTDIYTHNGKFHADDVFCYAALRMMGCTAKLHRVNQLPDKLGETELAFDIGGGRYDHHQQKREIRSNGIPYAAFGLIMRDFYLLLDLTAYEHIALDKGFVKELDAADNNYFRGNALAGVIGSFNPEWDHDTSEEAQMEAFLEAAEIATKILNKQIVRVKAKTRAKNMVSALEETAECHCIFMDRFAPVAHFLKWNPDIHWTCCLSTRGDWTINAVRGPKNTPKAIMPKEFRGASPENLPEGMKFCHRNGFMASFDSLLSARLFAKRYLANAELYSGPAVTDDYIDGQDNEDED